MYKVFPVEDGFQIFWCPSAPLHYNDKIPYNNKVYPQKQAAYRRCKQLNERIPEKAIVAVKEEAIAS